MSGAKKSHYVDGARRRPNKQTAEPSPQIPSADLNVVQTLNTLLDAELLSRIESQVRLAREVDEYYEYKLLVGKGKQAMKRCAEYMRAQDQILSHLCEDINESMCRARFTMYLRIKPATLSHLTCSAMPLSGRLAV